SHAVRRISMNDAVRSALGLIGFQYRADGIVVRQDLGGSLPDVETDPHQLAQVLVNLLGNAHAALHQSWGDRNVTVRTWTEAGRVLCQVTDTGPGIPADARTRIFSPFFSTRKGGAGLGLTVSRNMLRSVGGDLALDASREGASFTFWLPAAAAQPELPGAEPKAPGESGNGSLRNRMIVVADDEGAIRSVLERFLRREGSRVIAVCGGRQALEVSRS